MVDRSLVSVVDLAGSIRRYCSCFAWAAAVGRGRPGLAAVVGLGWIGRRGSVASVVGLGGCCCRRRGSSTGCWCWWCAVVVGDVVGGVVEAVDR